MVCDAKWDCPQGLDEVDSNWCGLKQNCTQMFKCRDANSCLHLGNVCDNKLDCILGDDESLCALHKFQCPIRCNCLALSVQCLHVHHCGQGNLEQLPLLAVSIHFSSPVFVYQVVSQLRIVEHLNLQRNDLLSLCHIFQKLLELKSLSLNNNQAEILDTSCIKNLPQLTTVLIARNNICFVAMKSFANLSNLSFVDLSNNEMKILPSHLIYNTQGRLHIDLCGNVFETIHEDAFSGLTLRAMKTSDYRLCCLVSTEMLCNATKMWHRSCQDFLSTTGLKFSCAFVFSVVFSTSLLSIGVQISTKKYKTNHGVNVLALNLNDMIFGLELLCVWLVDLMYRGTFFLTKENWLNSFPCYFMFTTVLHFCICAPGLSLCLLS